MEKKILNLLNIQIQKEFESAYLYFALESYFDSIGLYGFANWYKIQAQEEECHAYKIYNFLIESNQHVELYQINKPEKKIESIEEALNMALRHEQYITKLIHNIYEEADNISDYCTLNFLDWFIDEQMEEEKNAQRMIDHFTLFGNSSEGLYLLDKEFAKRKH